jgi:hypothetical protein
VNYSISELNLNSFWKDLENNDIRLSDSEVPIKVAVKQSFDNVDSIIFEAALALNAIETRTKQKEYIN